MMTTMTLPEFLNARYAEEAATAQAATPGPWTPYNQGFRDRDGIEFITSPYHELDISSEDAEHITRYDPARVLADIEAKRQAVKECASSLDMRGDEEKLAEAVLRALALPYADHPDYDPDWRP